LENFKRIKNESRKKPTPSLTDTQALAIDEQRGLCVFVFVFVLKTNIKLPFPEQSEQ
jgi:hypothetical protein